VLITSFTIASTLAQIDSSKTTKINSEIGVVSGNKNLKISTTNTKTAPNANIDLNINNKLNTNTVNNNLNKYTKNDGNFLLETLPENNDITGKRYWKNEDITHKRLASNMSLGTISTTSKVVRVICRDHGAVDGDIIKIYINEQPLPNNVVLRGGYYMVYLNLEKGYNRIDFQALNQGLYGPNTAELKLYDEQDNLIASKEWNLPTGATATIGVIQK
jgi:hypothetical protein